MSDMVICLPSVFPNGPKRCFRIPMLIEIPRFPVDPNPPDPIRDLQVLATIDALTAHLSKSAAAGIARAVSDGVGEVQRELGEGMTVSRAQVGAA